MQSFVINVQGFFKLDRKKDRKNDNGGYNFKENKKRLLIPMYQREYKWSSEKIEGLIQDIDKKDKFLGIIILDEREDAYEIVDGQQRITTCFLVMMALYNLYYGAPLEQRNIHKHMHPYGAFVLKNETVGDFISEKDGLMSLSIDKGNDIYEQAADFERANEIITEMLDFDEKEKEKKLQGYLRNLLECDFLVMINEEHKLSSPIEQVFLDINEKTQELDAEDIFKGHCFDIYAEDYYTHLRENWIKLKKCATGFKRFGYNSLSEYLYLRILEKGDYAPKKLTEKLTVERGKHYLDGRNMDKAEALLNDMISYGTRILQFRDNLSDMDYLFDEFYPNARHYRNSPDIPIIKLLAIELLDSSPAQYQKLPFMGLISHLLGYSRPSEEMSHDKFRKMVCNLYIYAMLFIFGSSRKHKGDIDRTVANALNMETNRFDAALKAAKELRDSYVSKFIIQNNYKEKYSNFIYTIIDFFSSNENRITCKYCNENNYRKEHLIVPGNGKRITWKEENVQEELQITKKHSSAFKNRAINYIAIPATLNERLKHDDIVSKIWSIEEWYRVRNEKIPTHVQIFVDHIKKLPSFQTLVDLKGENEDKSELIRRYNEFMEEYFGEEKQEILLGKLTVAFNKAFQN